VTKYVEWCDPWDMECKYNVVMRMKVEDVIAWQKEDAKNRYHKYFKGYETDEDALQDFMVVHWAEIKEYPE
jgi:hypothetical protein